MVICGTERVDWKETSCLWGQEDRKDMFGFSLHLLLQNVPDHRHPSFQGGLGLPTSMALMHAVGAKPRYAVICLNADQPLRARLSGLQTDNASPQCEFLPLETTCP